MREEGESSSFFWKGLREKIIKKCRLRVRRGGILSKLYLKWVFEVGQFFWPPF